MIDERVLTDARLMGSVRIRGCGDDPDRHAVALTAAEQAEQRNA